MSDAFQLIALKRGMMATLGTTTIPELVTEDKKLRKTAISEGLKAFAIAELLPIAS